MGALCLAFAFSPSCEQSPPPAEPNAQAPVAAQRMVRDAGPVAAHGATPTAPAAPRDISGVIAGQILSRGGEVEGTLITLAGSGVWPPRVVRAGADGSFRFEDVPTGVYGVSARLESRVAEPREGVWLDAGGRVFLALRLEPGTSLTGRVVSSLGGAPVEGAELQVSADALALAPRSTRSDAQGRFRVDGLLRRPQRLSVSAPGFVPQTAREVRPGRPVTLRLVPAATLSGVVYDSLDHPVAGARVEVLATGRGRTPLGAPVSAPAEFATAEFATAAGAASLGTTSGPVPRIPLTPSAEQPTHGADAASGPGAALPWTGSGGASALTDAEGHFQIEGVAPGPCALLATHPEHAPGIGDALRLRPGQRLQDQTLVLPDGSLVTGRVVDSRGFPAAGVPVLLRAEREPLPRMVVSARDGAFEFAHVLGVASLTATPPGLPKRRERLDAPAEGELEITLRLEDAFIALEGRVLDDAGFPLAGAQVACRSLRYQAPTTRLTLSEGDGSFRFRGLPAPPWRVEVSASGRISRELEVEEPGEPLEIRLAEAGEVHLSLRSSFDDTPLIGAQVSLSQAERELPGRAGARAGDYVVPDVPRGTLTLRVSAEAYLPLEREVTLRARPGSALRLELGVLELSPGGSVEGDVVDAHGQAVSGARIALNGEVVPGITTNAEGHFALVGVVPDTYHISAMHPVAGQGERALSVTVYASQTTPGADITLSGTTAAADNSAPNLRTGVAVSVETRGGHVVITQVLPGSRAARAGLRPQDVLVSVDGQRLSLGAQARSALRGPVGEDAVLVTRRAGRRRRVVVPRERYALP